MNEEIDRENFLTYLKPVYDQYNPGFSTYISMKESVDDYINNKYPSVKKFAYLFNYRVFFSEKIQKSQKDGSYNMILLNAIAVRSFLRFYEYVRDNDKCKIIHLKPMFRYFRLEYTNNLHVKYLLRNNECPYNEWIDIFGLKNKIETAIDNYNKENS